MDHADLPFSAAPEVRDRCLCLHLQRAARVVARRFDEAFRPFGLTNGQYSLMMALNRPEGPRLGDLVPLLGLDRTTLTAALKPLERRGLVRSVADSGDRRARRLELTDEGRALLARALPVWRATHDEIDAALSGDAPEPLRVALREVARPATTRPATTRPA